MVGDRKSSSDKSQCLICGKNVDSKWVKEFEHQEAKVCRNCIFNGKIGKLIAEAFLEEIEPKKLQNSEYRKIIFYETERIMEVTQMHFYKCLFHGAIDMFSYSPASKAKSESDDEVQNSERQFVDENELLDYLEDWKSIKEIKKHFRVSEVELSSVLNKLFFSGQVLKRILTDDQMFMRAGEK